MAENGYHAGDLLLHAISVIIAALGAHLSQSPGSLSPVLGALVWSAGAVIFVQTSSYSVPRVKRWVR